MTGRYHAGEVEVQRRAGVRGIAERVGEGIRPIVSPQARDFLEEQALVVVGSVGADGRVWASMLAGEPGFVRPLDENTVVIDAEPATGDPLAGNLAVEGSSGAVGLLFIDLATRRRMRLNGQAERVSGGLRVRVEQVYPNCLKYVQMREREVVVGGAEPGGVRRLGDLAEGQWRLISEADTFFVASAHPTAGADASHRGGRPGFVRFVGEDTLEFPDYSGNTMFNTLGNIAANPNAGLLFVDFEGGSTLQLSGRARILWDAGRAARFAGAERVVEFEIERAVETNGGAAPRWRLAAYSPFNPS